MSSPAWLSEVLVMLLNSPLTLQYFSPAGWDWREGEVSAGPAQQYRGLAGAGDRQTGEAGSEEGKRRLVRLCD